MKELQNTKVFIEKHSTKNIYSAFKVIHGINTNKLKRLNLIGGFDKIKVGNLKNKINRINPIINNAQFFFNIENNKIINNVNAKVRAKSYQGMRHTLRLPVRGQRTHTNSKTSRRNVKK